MAKTKKSPESDMERIYNDIRKRIKKRYENRAEVISHILAYAVFNGSLWVFFMPSGVFFPLAIILTFGWLIGLIIHVVNGYYLEISERAIMRELDRLAPLMEKAKNDAPLRERLVALSEDGELFEIEEDEDLQNTIS